MAYIQPAGLSQNNSLLNYLEINTPTGTVDKTKYVLTLFPQTAVLIVVRFYNNNAKLKIGQ
jgi:hypothetical protein